MKQKLLVASLILCLSLIIFYTKATLAETCTPGVAEGDYFCYEMYAVFTSSDPNAVIDVPEFEQNNTDWVQIDVTDVSGSVICQVYTVHFESKTDKFELKTDLDPNNSGSLTFSDLGVPICAANLEVGDTLSTVELTVEETLSRTYPSGDRETNYVSWNSTLDYGDCYFDKKTGVLVELNRTHLYVNPVTDEVIEKVDIVEMTDSSFWAVPDFPIFLGPSSLIMVAAIGAFLCTPVFYSHMHKENDNS